MIIDVWMHIYADVSMSIVTREKIRGLRLQTLALPKKDRRPKKRCLAFFAIKPLARPRQNKARHMSRDRFSTKTIYDPLE